MAVGENMAACAAAAFHGDTVYVHDIAADARWTSGREETLALGFRAAWSLCLRSSTHEVLGTFSILYPEPRLPSAAELRFLDLIADTAAVAIERYRDEERLHAQAQVLSRIHDAVIMFDLDGNVLQWNDGAERMFGYSAPEAVGCHVATLCAEPDDYAWLDTHLFQPLKRDGRLERVARLRRRSGELLYAHVSLSLLNDAQGQPNAMVGYVLDVSARVEAEKELNARVREQVAVARLGQMALTAPVLQELLDRAVEIVAETLEIELCEVFERLRDENALLLRAGVGWREGMVGHRTISTDDGASQAQYTLGSAEPVIVTDLAAETRFKDEILAAEHAITSGVTIVVPGTEHPYGVLGAHSTRPRRFSDNDVSFLQSVANVLASAIQRMRFEEVMRDAHDDLERRVEERTTELARANQSLRDEVVDRMGVENALRDSESQYRMLFERNPLPAWVFDIYTRHILAVNETAVWQYGYTRDEFLSMTINELHPPAEAARVLDYAGQFAPETAYIGVWKHRKQDETIIDVEVFVYEVLFQGRWARLMLASDITERRRTEQEFRLMETITRSVSEARDTDAALYAVLRSVCEATGWLLGEAWLPTADRQRMRCTPAWHCSTSTEGLDSFREASRTQEFEHTEGLIGRSWASRQPVWLSDVTREGSFLRAREAAASGLRAGISFPVLAGDEVVAVLAFFLREPRLEDEHQVKLVSTIAAQVAIAIQRKRAEEQLRESEERFRLLVEGAHDYAIYMIDTEGRIASWNRGAERLKGYTAEEVLGQSVSLFYTPEEAAREVPQRALAQAAAEGAFESEGWHVRKNGERFWASVTVTTLHDPNGVLRGFVKVTRDIDESKRAEEQLKQSEARLARAQEFSLLMVAHSGLDGRWLKVPPLLCATLAYREEELLAQHVADVTHPDDFAAEWAQCERLAKGEAKSFDLEKRFLRRDGKVIWVYQNTSVVLDAEDRPLHLLTYIRDITQRKEAEDELRRREMQLSEAQRLAHLGSWEWDVASGRLEWSEELCRIYGIAPRTPMTHEAYLERVHAEDRARVQTAIDTALGTREPFVLEMRILRADGETRHLLSQGAVADASVDSVRLVGVCLDITERKRSEERLREYMHRLQHLSQRLLEAQETERRRIARELHDQIGQDLSVIKINLQSLARLPSTNVGAHIEETIRVVEGVLMTARNLSVELRPSMLDDLGLVAALRWYLDRQASRAGVRLHFAADVRDRLSPTIETACFRLAQEALTNVLRHAGAHQVEVTLAQSANQLEMRVVDDGRGFDVDAARAHAARGESFGLLGMEERALLAGGELEIISKSGKGTSVVARFPVTLTSGVNNERH
jgi:PAS domain S-box-containing protein